MKVEDYRANDSFRIENHQATFPNVITIEEAEKKLKKNRKKLSEIQDKMYAHDKYSVLICFQGMDTAGKDSLIREVFKNFNARGVEVQSFKTPTSKEYQHDYLWRHYIALPEKGKFGVFNRTHYENVLVSRVHPEYVLNEKLPKINTVSDLDEAFWEKRFTEINNFEKHLTENGTIIFKFFLNIDKEEQKERLLRRLEEEKHNWKFSPGDLAEREKWNDYMKYYEEAISKTSTDYAPWYIIPSNRKEISRYLVSKILLTVMQQFEDIKYPELDEEIEDNIGKYKTALLNESK